METPQELETILKYHKNTLDGGGKVAILIKGKCKREQWKLLKPKKGHKCCKFCLQLHCREIKTMVAVADYSPTNCV